MLRLRINTELKQQIKWTSYIQNVKKMRGFNFQRNDYMSNISVLPQTKT